MKSISREREREKERKREREKEREKEQNITKKVANLIKKRGRFGFFFFEISVFFSSWGDFNIFFGLNFPVNTG
jgi:hypothetical protein